MYGKVEICGVNTSKLKILTETQKTELIKKSKNGDKYAREELISGNLRLVLSVIQSFSNRGENPDDLFQVGCIGLIKAVDNFDQTQNVKFSTYAVPMIIGELRRYLRDYNSLRVPRSMRDLAYKAMRARERLSNTLLREPSVSEIAIELGESRQDVISALESVAEPMSLYEPIYSDTGDSVYVLDRIEDTENTDESWLNDIAIREALASLAERERRIIALRFYGGKTQTEVSEEIGISQAQVSRLEKQALEKVKKKMSC